MESYLARRKRTKRRGLQERDQRLAHGSRGLLDKSHTVLIVILPASDVGPRDSHALPEVARCCGSDRVFLWYIKHLGHRTTRIGYVELTMGVKHHGGAERW